MRPLAARLGFELLADEGAGLNAAITRGMRHLRNQGETDIAVVHADLPLFQASEFDRVAARHAAGPARKLTLVSDLVGNGTNLRLCRPGDAIPPLYGKMSAARHREAARRAGLAVETVASPILEFDCDTPEDLRRLMQMPQSEADDRGRFAGLGFPLSAAPRAEERSRP